MRSTRNVFWAMAAVGGYLIWRNRFAIQRQLESMGVKTPLMKENLTEAAKSLASKAVGKMERGANLAEHDLSRKMSNY